MTDLNRIATCISKRPELRNTEELSLLTDFLATILVFKKLDSDLLLKLTRYLQLAEYKLDQRVCSQNEKGETFYVLLKGQIDIIKDGVKMVTLNKVGTAFGEIALTSSIAVRIATVVCS
jgi:trk system potassium uptake protein TrkA